MIDEGYIKFNTIWKKQENPKQKALQQLNHWRQVVYNKGLIGAYPDGIGYGNISTRIDDTAQFWISGSKTGNYPTLNYQHFAKVTQIDVPKNTVYCEGETVASSESMSHAVIFQELNWVRGIVHVHHLALWKQLLHQVPTTPASVPYGTPEMAESIIGLIHSTDVGEQKIFAMAGHEEGIFTFGKSLEEAVSVILRFFK